MNVKLKCTRKRVQEGLVNLEYVQSRSQLADILTKRARKPSVETSVDSFLSRDSS